LDAETRGGMLQAFLCINGFGLPGRYDRRG
jgi:hypothetical protein